MGVVGKLEISVAVLDEYGVILIALARFIVDYLLQVSRF